MGRINHWIKMSTMLPDEEIMQDIQRRPEGPAFCWLWIRLLALAGKIGRRGEISITPTMPFDAERLAQRFQMNRDFVSRGLEVFEQYGLVTEEDGMLRVAEWQEYTGLQSGDEYREKEREKKRRQRERKRKEAAAKNSLPGEERTCTPEMVFPEMLETDALDGISPEEAHRIREDQNELLNLAQKTGLANSCWGFEEVLRLYGLYGREKVEYAMNEAARHGKVNVKYVETICRNYGRRKYREGYRNEGIPDWN